MSTQKKATELELGGINENIYEEPSAGGDDAVYDNTIARRPPSQGSIYDDVATRNESEVQLRGTETGGRPYPERHYISLVQHTGYYYYLENDNNF